MRLKCKGIAAKWNRTHEPGILEVRAELFHAKHRPSALGHDLSTAHQQVFAGDETAQLRGKKQRRIGRVLDRSGPAQRHLFFVLFAGFGSQHGPDLLGQGQTGGDDIDP